MQESEDMATPTTPTKPTPIKVAAAAVVAPTLEPAPVVAPLPVVAPEPQPFAALASAIAALKDARALELRLREARNLAVAAHDVAKAALEAQRAKVLAASADLADGDLGDNFVPLTDDEAARLSKDALAARKGIVEHVRAKLFGA